MLIFRVLIPPLFFASVALGDVLQVNCPAPLVSFDLYILSDGSAKLPPRPTVETGFTDDSGVDFIKYDGQPSYFVANITAQASGISNNDLDVEGDISKNPKLTQRELRGLDWLLQNTTDLDGGRAIVWHYTSDHVLNDTLVRAGWPSAFAQADGIKALLLAFAKTSEQKYLDAALRAGMAYTVPCEAGGLVCNVGGIAWFEEIPVPFGYAPLILNGHLYSLVILHRLATMTGNAEIRQAFETGFANFKKLLLRFDTGYWTVYQIRPRLLNVYLTVDPLSSGAELRRLRLTAPATKPTEISFGDAGKASNSRTGFAGSLTPTSSNGSKLAGTTRISLAPEPLGIAQDPVTFDGFSLEMEFADPGCKLPFVGTYDWRAGSNDSVALPLQSVSQTVDGCLARYSVPSRLDQWSQLTPFYHDWHTRLVTELWHRTADPTMYTTAVRWRQYEAPLKEAGFGGSDTRLLQGGELPLASDRDDRIVEFALMNIDPASLSSVEIDGMLQKWAVEQGISEVELGSLERRAGTQHLVRLK